MGPPKFCSELEADWLIILDEARTKSLGLTKLMVSHDMPCLTATKLIAIGQCDLHLTPVFKHAMDCHF